MSSTRPENPIAVESITQWLQCHEAEMRGFLRSRGLQTSDVDDMIQDVLFKAIQSESIPPPDEMRPWMFTIARRNCIDYHRKRRPESSSGADHFENTPLHESALDLVMQNEEYQIYRHCFEQLSSVEKTVVSARLAGQSHDGIATQYGLPDNSTSERAFFRAKQKLTECVRSKSQ
jgi:RNA polymerase sigma factor (sigma-70 family)